jgi:thymidylate synthase (FAD)
MTPINGVEILKFLEKVARTCYKTEGNITEDSYIRLITKLVDRKHEAMLEHFSLTIKFICDRGVSHELVRHRLASFAQESTRYCNYSANKKGMVFIQPCWFSRDITGEYDPDKKVYPFDSEHGLEQAMASDYINLLTYPESVWFNQMLGIERDYNYLTVEKDWKPEEARSILSNSLKTEIVITANLREWMHIIDLRAAPTAHPQMRELMLPLLIDLYTRIPILFNKSYAKYCTTKA